MKNQYRQLHIEEILNFYSGIQSPVRGTRMMKNGLADFKQDNIPLLILVPWFDQEEPF